MNGICPSLLPQRSPLKNPAIGIGSIVLTTEPTEYTRKMQLDTEYTEVSTERTEIFTGLIYAFLVFSCGC